MQTSDLQSPVVWKTETYTLKKHRPLATEGESLMISFTATRTSKTLGYIPIVGSVIGIRSSLDH